MLRWLKTSISDWADRVMEARIASLAEETRSLKAELERRNGGRPIVLSDEDRERLRKASEGIDPERLKRICVFNLDEPGEHDARPDSS